MSMSRLSLLWLVCFLLPVSTVIPFSADAGPLGEPFKDPVIRLFNGKNLDGWYTFLRESGKNNDPKKVFTINKGVLRISGEEWGCITTNEEYDNYHLIVEYKWGKETHGSRLTKARDGGVLIHSKGKDGGYSGTWMHSLECQLIEGGTGDIIVVGNGTPDFAVTSTVRKGAPNNSAYYDANGTPETFTAGRINWYGRDPEWKDVIGFRGKNDLEKKLGKWNKLEIHAIGDDFKIFLNGKLVNHGTRVKPSSGRIQVQSEAAEMFFRRIDLIPMGQKGK